MAAVDIEDDVQTAIRNFWKADPDLVAINPELKAGELPSPQPSTYAHVKVEKGRTNERQTGGAFKDYRNVTLTVRGLKDAVTAAVATMLNKFNLNLMPTSLAATPTLTMPSGAPFVRWWPINDGAKKVDKDHKSGNEIWEGQVIGEVYTVRTTV